jgi:putative transcriptional regulator
MPPEPDGAVTNQIRRLRFDHGEMTQQALAERVGVTRQTIIALEAGKYVPSLGLAFRLARAFGVGVEDVFRYEGEASGPVKKDGEHPAP